MENYTKQGNDFLSKHGITFEAVKLGHFPYFEDDKEPRDVYQITLTRGEKVYSFKFGQCIGKSETYIKQCNAEELQRSGRIILQTGKALKVEAPTAYDVLAAIQKSDIGTFSDFCSEFGYDTDSRKAEKLYFAVQEEYKNIERLFGDVLSELQEIQ